MQTLVMLLALKFIAWLVEVGGLLSLHKCASITNSQAILRMTLAEDPRPFQRSILEGDARTQSTIPGACGRLPAESGLPGDLDLSCRILTPIFCIFAGPAKMSAMW